MVFSSISFLYYFLPAVLLVYFMVPRRAKNLVLLVSSLFFYFCGEPVYLLLMIAVTLSGYLHGLWINRAKNGRYAKLSLISSIFFITAPLLFFKYTGFAINNVNALFGLKIPAPKLALPIGISFYTFQILSYTIDVYRGNARVQKSFIDFSAYVSLFPQLIAGPIVRYTTIESELSDRTHSLNDAAYGIKRFVIGLSKKVIIANSLGELGDILSQLGEKTVLLFWLKAISFMIQIYYDFSGYSDMAIGLGRIFGFHFPENFNYPFISKSLTEFWRRWHISLGTWFRDYVYIPLGGNRKGTVKWLRNIFIVWFLTGFWHGAEWNFIAWGLYFAVFLCAEKLFLHRLLDKAPVLLRRVYTLFFILVSFILFNGDGLAGCLADLKGMFGFLDAPVFNTETLYYFRSYAVTLLAAAVGSTPLPRKLADCLGKYKPAKDMLSFLEPVFQAALLLLVTAYLIDGSFNPFLYFRF
ncbi:MAG: MBOAT family protein [Clostridiaceae bacterium]|nr:MBOAT family protein [Clostridiaceae bacterium]